jgi:hypothetical protein
MITFSLAPNNQLLPYVLRPVTLAFKYEEESEEENMFHILRTGGNYRVNILP